MISVEDLIQWANDYATRTGFIKARDLTELAESVDLCAPKLYRYGNEELDGEPLRVARYAIEVEGAIPDHCYDCPAHNCETGYCQADKAERSSDWRPFWCPAKELN